MHPRKKTKLLEKNDTRGIYIGSGSSSSKQQHHTRYKYVPRKIEALRIEVHPHEVPVALLRGVEHVRTALHQAHVHRPPLCHGLEKGVVQLAQVKVEEAVGREARAAGAAQVSMGRLVVRLVLRR